MRVVVEAAELSRLPERFGRAERTAILLGLRDEHGANIRAQLIIPSLAFSAALPDQTSIPIG